MSRTPNLSVLAKATLAALAALPALTTISAHAQSSAPAAKVDDSQIQEVTVTATRRVEPLQKVPVAVSVMDGTALEQARARAAFIASIVSLAPAPAEMADVRAGRHVTGSVGTGSAALEGARTWPCSSDWMISDA